MPPPIEPATASFMARPIPFLPWGSPLASAPPPNPRVAARTTGQVPDMSAIATAFLLALALSAALLALLARVLPPDFLAATVNDRTNHTQPARQIGGLAGGVSAVVVIGVLAILSAWTDAHMALAAGAGAALLVLTGYLDDRHDLTIRWRFLLQFIAAFAFVLALDPSARILHEAVPLHLERLLTIVFLVWVTNMTNFMDGLDLMVVSGVGVPQALLACLGLVGLASGDTAILCAVSAGALAGFAPFNTPPARIFLGDSGSLSIGFLTGATMVLLAFEHPLLAALPFLYFFVDSGSVIVLRLVKGENILKAHSTHAYQIARRAGWPVPRVTGMVALAGLICTALYGLAIASQAPMVRLAAVLAAVMVAAALVVQMRRAGARG